MGCEIREGDTGGRTSFAFEAFCDGRVVGQIRAHKTRTKARGHGTLFDIDGISVNVDWRRRGLATMLYEHAAAEACRRRGRLASFGPRAATTKQFWEKQLAKGRAERIRVKGFEIFVLRDCPAPRSLSRWP